MTRAGFWVVASLFASKIAWNGAIPYVLNWRRWKRPETRHSGISMMPGLEFGLLGLTVALYDGRKGPGEVGLLGLGMIALSYGHMFVVGGILGWVLQRYEGREKSPGDERP